MDSNTKPTPSQLPTALHGAHHKKSTKKDNQSDERSTEDKDEKKTRRLSLTPHDKEYYRKKSEQELKEKEQFQKKYEQVNSHALKLEDLVNSQNFEILNLQKQIKKLTQENAALKKDGQELIDILKAENTKVDVPLSKTKARPDTKTDNPEPTPVSYYDQITNALGTAYGYVPSFSSLTAKLPPLPTMPKLFSTIETHHEAKPEDKKLRK